MPFNWKTPVGYAVAYLMQFTTWMYLLILCSCIMSFLAGICWLLITFVKDINIELNNINKLAKLKSNHIKLTGKLRDFVQFHCTVKELSILFYKKNIFIEERKDFFLSMNTFHFFFIHSDLPMIFRKFLISTSLVRYIKIFLIYI